MSDSAAASRRRPYAAASIVAIAAMGSASALLYVSILLSFAFLLPVQVAFGRSGRRAGLAAAGISAVVITAALAWRLVAASAAISAVGVPEIASALPPIVLLGALCLLNAPFGESWEPAYKAIGLAALCALAALPIVISLDSDRSVAAYLEGQIADFLVPLKNQAGEGYDTSALMASLNPKELVAASITMLRDSYAAILFLLLGGSWRLGNRLSGLGSKGRQVTVPIDELHLPYPLIWAFLSSWALVLAAVAFKMPAGVAAFAWNCALTVSLAYAAQGLGIVTYLFKSWSMPKSMRVIIAIMAILALLTPFGIAIAASLPLFGVTEIWIHYRKPKGVGA
jgi:hypothetical protein